VVVHLVQNLQSPPGIGAHRRSGSNCSSRSLSQARATSRQWSIARCAITFNAYAPRSRDLRRPPRPLRLMPRAHPRTLRDCLGAGDATAEVHAGTRSSRLLTSAAPGPRGTDTGHSVSHRGAARRLGDEVEAVSCDNSCA